MDKYLLAQAFAPSTAPEWRLRQGQVVSVQSDYTMTVTIAGSSEQIPGVRSIMPPPPPNTAIWLYVNDTDLFALGAISAAGTTIAPRVYRTADQAINNASATPITWTAEDVDPYGFATPNATQVVVNVPGRYMASSQIDFASNTTGVRSASIIVNNTTVVGAQRIAAFTGVAHVNVTSVPFTVSSSASVAVWVEQNSSASLNVVASGSVSPGLGVYYLGP